ncbi:PQQ-binding-like beta-propeller repeat protein [Streptomyces sp. NPDC127197]|uniref:outer membrane protein assembly factor BamB family protein n=1 Tax=Streptomyces sp. NPDC127197 TaxID=3345388 RepID=UPI00362ACD2F
MIVLPVEVTRTSPHAPVSKAPLRTLRRLVAAGAALLLAAPLLAAAHQARPAPYGDRLTVHARVQHPTDLRTRDGTVEAYDPTTGEVRWRHARDGRRPLTVLPARGEAITLWDDGFVTATDGRAVRWHRALPASADWLTAHGGTGVLRPLGRGILAVLTPRRVAAYRTADGDLRWVLPARKGCWFAPERALHRGGALLIAQPCARGAWTAQLVAVDDLGRIAPHRRPLGNEVLGRGPNI